VLAIAVNARSRTRKPDATVPSDTCIFAGPPLCSGRPRNGRRHPLPPQRPVPDRAARTARAGATVYIVRPAMPARRGGCAAHQPAFHRLPL